MDTGLESMQTRKTTILKELEELQIATPKLVTLSFFNLPTKDLRLQGK